MNRKYSDDELRAILAKALQEGRSDSQDGGDGFSLAEIKEIGAEVGIDAGSLERAARSIAAGTGHGPAWAAGGPTRVGVERQAVGSVDSVPTNKILSAIRAEMATPGELSELKGLIEWRSSGELGHHVITLSSDEGVTTVAGMADLRQAAVITHVPATFLGLIGAVVGFMAAANNGNELGMMLAVALLPVILLATRGLFARLSRSETAKLGRAVEELAALVGTPDDEEPGSAGEV